MNWKHIDTQKNLDDFDSSNCWDDSEVVEFIGLIGNEDYFPDDVSRSGYQNKNVHLLVEACSENGSHLEIVLIDCDHFSSDYFSVIHFQGKVCGLKRVEVFDYQDNLRMRCSRIIYRWLEREPKYDKSYFLCRDRT